MDLITKVIVFALFVGLLSSVGSMEPAKAAPVNASGADSSVCNQDVSNTSGVSAVRLIGGDCVVTFTNVGTVTWTLPAGVTTYRVLIIGGGGGGGGDYGGGGGGGGFIDTVTTISQSTASTTIKVGAGGAGNAGGGTSTASAISQNGDTSTIFTFNSPGGGGGGSPDYSADGSNQGRPGASGGGSSRPANGSAGANGISGLGNNGGGSNFPVDTVRSGGGGGAGAVGTTGGTTNSSAIGGAGGDGRSSDISGSIVFYSGGGGGGTHTGNSGTCSNGTNLTGVVGGGAAGGAGGGGAAGQCLNSGSTNRGNTGAAGTANTGGGGGGGSVTAGRTTSAKGGDGGSGIVIVRYSDTTAPTYSSSSISSDGLNLTLTYNETLSATTAVPSNFVVTVNSTETRTVSSVSTSGASITLALSSRIEGGQSVAVTYTDPTGGDDANAIQDLWGNDAITLTNQSITNTSNSSNDSAISLNGSNQYIHKAGEQIIPASTVSGDFFTVEAWIFPTAAVANSVIVSQGTNSNRFYVKRTADGIIRFFRQGQSSESVCGVAPQDQWTHVAIVVGTSQSKCFLDGSLFNTYSLLSTTPVGTGFTIGSYTPILNDTQYLFAGRIDEVRIWSTDRSSSIANDMKSYGGALSNGLIAYYDFNDLSGSTLINRSTGGTASFNLTTINSPQLVSIETTSTVQAYTVITFPRSYLVASGGWKTPANRQLRVLAVGGGGGGGFNSGGGGSGGGWLSQLYSANNETVSVVVGVGGSGAAPVTTPATRTTATNGTNSIFGNSSAGGGNYGNNVSINGAVGGAAVNGYGKGGNASTSTSINATSGSAGYPSDITGSNLFYGGGGGGGGWNASTLGGSGGAGGGGGGAGSNRATPVSGTALLGGGGGGSRQNDQVAGNGGSGVVILAYINDTPTILVQPLSDTTTAGIVETFTITTSAAPAPLTKSVQWQFTADTVTGTTGWTNASTGSGFTTDTFTTVALTKSMNNYRYRAVVTFSDTSTLSVVETSTVAILTINDSITITSDTSTITRKYGDAQTVRSLTYSGGTTSTGLVGTSTSHTVRGSFGTQAAGRIVLDTSTSTTVFRVDTATVVGSYVETITVTDFKGATATYTQRVIVNQADTLTVQADTLTAITFGGTLSPTTTVTGLKSGDTVATTTYGNVSCANGGRCAVGDIGPGGGVVFFEITNSSDSQTAITGYTSGGIYLEAAPVGWGNGISVSAGETTGTAYLDPVVNWCNTTTDLAVRQFGVGQGANNTRLIDAGCTSGAAQIASDLVLNGKNDWYLPSQDELTQMGVQKNLIGLLYGLTNCYGSTCYWSSTEPSGSSARVLQVGVSSNSMGSNDKTLSASNQVMMRPIRAFSPITNGSETVTAGAPSAAGTYSLRPTAITLANGVNTNNYVNVVYRSSSVTINRAFENPRISMQPAKVAYDTGTATQALTASSGVGTGAIFYIIGAGSAAGCSISGSAVRNTSDGVCNVIAFKQASTNYFADSATAVAITFTRFVPRPVQVQLYPSMIPLNQGNALETTTVTSATLTITSISGSGGSYTVSGTGFTNVTSIRIGGTDLVLTTNYTVSSTTSISITNASGMVGPLFISLADGQQAVRFTFPN